MLDFRLTEVAINIPDPIPCFAGANAVRHVPSPLIPGACLAEIAPVFLARATGILQDVDI